MLVSWKRLHSTFIYWLPVLSYLQISKSWLITMPLKICKKISTFQLCSAFNISLWVEVFGHFSLQLPIFGPGIALPTCLIWHDMLTENVTCIFRSYNLFPSQITTVLCYYSNCLHLAFYYYLFFFLQFK